jgi:predicted ATPase/DNA-binding CsgD family transcriptional regulator/DNA-binding XRE family transcriptional regulator
MNGSYTMRFGQPGGSVEDAQDLAGRWIASTVVTAYIDPRGGPAGASAHDCYSSAPYCRSDVLVSLHRRAAPGQRNEPVGVGAGTPAEPQGLMTAFGETLRHYRERAGLTQKALAERAGLSISAVSALEQGVRRRPYPHTVDLLAAVLSLGPDERAAFDMAASPAEDPAPPHSMLNAIAPATLPAPRTPLLGRERERAALHDLVVHPDVRLVTLTGMGGCGKTRLALQVAADLVATFQDRVRLVELAPVTDAMLVPDAVAASVGVGEAPGVPPLDTLVARFRHHPHLLVLDNCEHLVDACAQLVEHLLGGCPSLRILATSREPLGVGGERQWRVPPLAVPDPDEHSSRDKLAGYPAVQLFVERARAVRPDFDLTQGNAGTVARICVRLDGIPLALELAAARVRVLAVEQILTRLDDTLRLLTGGGRAAPTRQQTLQATLDWSYALLTQPERAVFRRLAVFAGGFRIEAAEAVCGAMGNGQSAICEAPSAAPSADCPLPIAADDVLDLLTALADKSLVQVDVGEPATQFHLLEPVRQYAAHHLIASGEREQIASQHAAWYLSVAEQAASELRGPAQLDGLSRLDRDYDNLRAALSHADQSGDLETLARLTVALTPYWEVRGTMSEGRRWLEPILAGDHSRPISTALQSRALLAAGRLAFFQADLAQSTRLLGESVSLGRESADEQVVATSSTWLGLVSNRQGHFAQAEQRLEASLAMHRTIGDDHGAAWAIHGLGAVAANREDYERAIVSFGESLQRFQVLGDRRFIAIASLELGYAEIFAVAGDRQRAGRRLRDGLRELLAVGDRVFMISGLLTLAEAEAQLGRPARAARMLGALAALRDAHGARITPVQRKAEARLVHTLRPQIGEAVLAAAIAEGRMLTVEQAIEETLRDDRTGRSSSKVPPPPGLVEALTPRERDVARLLAQGYTDRQIAEALTIALSTVGSHVHHVLAKLGVHSRWQVAEWATAHGLAETRPD